MELQFQNAKHEGIASKERLCMKRLFFTDIDPQVHEVEFVTTQIHYTLLIFGRKFISIHICINNVFCSNDLNLFMFEIIRAASN